MIIDRILNFLEVSNISKRQFYRDTELSNGFLDKVKDIGMSKVVRILETYPQINMKWLVLGKGEMTEEEDIIYKTKYSQNVTISNSNKKGHKKGSEPNIQKMSPFEPNLEEYLINKISSKIFENLNKNNEFLEHIKSSLEIKQLKDELKEHSESINLLDAIIGYNIATTKRLIVNEKGMQPEVNKEDNNLSS